MQNKPLHIISFENPFPPNFGGVIDVFYKIKALHELGYDIYLHCFHDGRDVVFEELKAITTKVYLYKKNKNPFFLFSKFPYPVICRFREELIFNIKTIDAPILFEGLHTTMVMNKTDLQNKKYLRLHNLESDFYAGMSKNETNYLKKIAYHFASKKYIEYQKNIPKFDHVFALSCYEFEVVKTMTTNVTYIPVFHGNGALQSLSEYGNYAFYHGDLRLADNKKAAKFLINVFKEIPDYKLIIASSNGKKIIEKHIGNCKNIEFVNVFDNSQWDKLLANAHINVMLSFQKSGTKLKIINSLAKSRFCLINNNMVDDYRVLKLCEMASTKEEFILKINELKNKPFLESNIRSAVFSEVLNDNKNGILIDKIISNSGE